MSNDYFRYAANILPGGTARSQPITQTFEALARAFELLPNPIDDGVSRGFSQPVQIAPALENNEAATLGQMQQIVETIAGLNPLADGSLQPVFRGSYDPDGSYTPMEFVAWEGGLYVNVLASSGVAPSDAGHWLLVMSPLNTGVVYYEALSGAVTRPMIAYHNGDYWMLAMDLPQAEMAIPGESLAWQRIPRDTTFIITPSITNPADGTEQFFGEITSSQYQTGPRFTGAHTKTVWQSSTESDFATIYAEEEITEGDLHTWALPLPDPLATVWIRVRYESNGFSSDWSPIVRVVIADYKADPPEWIDPVANEADWMPGSTLQITPYSPNLTDEHVATSWQILSSQGVVIWQSLEDANNLTSITPPNNIFNPEAVYTFRAWHIGNFFGEQDWGEISVTTIAAPVAVLVSPLENEISVSGTPELKIDVDPRFTHKKTRWVIYRESDVAGNPGVFDLEVYDSGILATHTKKTTAPPGVLDENTDYQWTALIETEEFGLSVYSDRFAFATRSLFSPSVVLKSTFEFSLARGGAMDQDADYIYLSESDYKYIYKIDKSNDSAVIERFFVDGGVQDLCVSGNHLVLATRNSSKPLIILNKLDFSFYSYLSIPDSAYGVYADDSNIFVAHAGGNGLTTIDAANYSLVSGGPSLPLVGLSVIADQNNVYYGYSNGLSIVDRVSLSVLTGSPALPRVYAFGQDDTFLFIGTVVSLCIMKKADFSIIAEIPMPGLVNSIKSDLYYVYIAHVDVQGGGGFTVLDKADWTIMGGTPLLPENSNYGPIGSDIELVGEKVYVSHLRENGLKVMGR